MTDTSKVTVAEVEDAYGCAHELTTRLQGIQNRIENTPASQELRSALWALFNMVDDCDHTASFIAMKARQ